MDDKKDKFVFDDRKKELTHTVVENNTLFGKEEYGGVVKTTDIVSSEKGTVRILMFLDSQKKQIQADIDKVEADLKIKKDAFEMVSKEQKEVRDLIGTRINFKKVQKDLEAEDEARAKESKTNAPGKETK